MVLICVDDLLFSSKIRHTAAALGVPIVFARSPAEILEQARVHQPALAIFDLNSQRTEPLSSIAALKADASMASIRTIGFVSHVQADLIVAARSAGTDEVLARSAFAARLPEILGSAL